MVHKISIGVAHTSKGNPQGLDNSVEYKKKGRSSHCLNAPEVDLSTSNVSISRDLHQQTLLFSHKIRTQVIF
jgi:hypothetical protein